MRLRRKKRTIPMDPVHQPKQTQEEEDERNKRIIGCATWLVFIALSVYLLYTWHNH